MNKSVKTIVGVAVFGAAAFAAYKYFYDSKKHYAQQILDAGKYGIGISNLLSFDKGYIKEWAKSAKTNNPTFVYNGNTYNTQGGLLKK